jgi:putative membrane fusion protein
MAKKKKKKKSGSVHIITGLFVVVCIAYTFRYFAYKIDTDIVKYDSMENTVVSQGLLIKSEWSTALPPGTAADYEVSEGDRVATGKPILRISKSEGADQNISLKIDKLNERIAEITKAEEDNNFFAADKEKLDANIQSNLNEIKTIAASGDLAKLQHIKSDLEANVYKKSLISGSESFSGQNLVQLTKEKETLEQIQKNNLNVIYALTSGIVSYELDGYEDVLKPENIKALKVSTILDIIKAQQDEKSSKKEEKSEGVKVVDNFEWYIAAVIPKGILTEEDMGRVIKVRFMEYGKTVAGGTLKHFDVGDEKGSLAVIKMDEQLRDFQRIRTAQVEIITKSKEGLIVPNKCIIEKDGQKGLFIERSGSARFVAIKVIITGERESLVENLSKENPGYNSKNYELKPYDRVILSVNKVKDNQMLPGAF